MRSKFKNFDFLRDCQYSTFDVGRSMFDVQSVRCLIQAIEAGSLFIKKPCHFGVVSYEVSVSDSSFPWHPTPETSSHNLQHVVRKNLIRAYAFSETALGKSGPCGAAVNAEIGTTNAELIYIGNNKLQSPPDLKIGPNKFQISNMIKSQLFGILVIVICLLFVFCYLKFFLLKPDTWNLNFLTTCCQKKPVKGLVESNFSQPQLPVIPA